MDKNCNVKGYGILNDAEVYILSGRTGRTLASHSDGARSIVYKWQQQVLWFVARICTVQYL